MIAKPHRLLRNFAELHERLGEVPLERIRIEPYPGSATEADLVVAGKPICELIDGVLVEKPVGAMESFLGSMLLAEIANVVKAGKLGVVLGEAGFIRFNEDLIRAPDVTFIPWKNFPDKKLPKEACWTVAPGLIVEVLSPGNTKAEIDRKLREFFSIGCKLAWIIDPATRTAKVHTSPTRFKLLSDDGTLDGGKVLPGFKLPMAEVFGAITPPDEDE